MGKASSDPRFPIINGLCRRLGLPMSAVIGADGDHSWPRIAIQVSPGYSTIHYRGWEAAIIVRSGIVVRIGRPAEEWTPALVADDDAIRDALTVAARDLGQWMNARIPR